MAKNNSRLGLPLQILHQQLQHIILDQSIDQHNDRLRIIVIHDIFISQVLQEADHFDGDIDVIVRKEPKERRHGVQRDKVGIKLGTTGENAELLEIIVEVDLAVCELVGLVGILEASLNVLLEAALEGQDEFLQGFQV